MKRPRLHRTGFTLLESIVALTILAAVAVVCLSVRVDTLVGAGELSRRTSAVASAGMILDLALANRLPGGVEDEDDADSIVWRGQRLGRAYECLRERVAAPNPLAREGASEPEWITLHRFVVRYDGVELEQLRPVPR